MTRLDARARMLSRKDGFLGLAEAYGLRLPEEVRGMEHGLAYEGLRSGQVDLVDAYGTDGKLLGYPVRLLEDDRRFFPPYLAAPLVRGEGEVQLAGKGITVRCLTAADGGLAPADDDDDLVAVVARAY